jgi:hypothetical protein
MIKDDLVREFSRECDEELVKLGESMAGIRERVEEEVQYRAEKVADKMCASCRCTCLDDAKGELEQGQRAVSLPL